MTVSKERALIFALAASIINQLSKVPERDLTIERVASVFADRLEANYPNDFDRSVFITLSGVTPRMIEDADAQAAGAVTTPEDDLKAFNLSEEEKNTSQYLAG